MGACARRLAFALLAGSASVGSAAELVVNWAPLAVPVEAYQIERRVEDGQREFTPIARVGGDATRFADRGVTVGVRYCYRVRGLRGYRTSPPSPPLCNTARESAPTPELVAEPEVEPEPESRAAPELRPELESTLAVEPASDPTAADPERRAEASSAVQIVDAVTAPVDASARDASASIAPAAESAPRSLPAPPRGEFREAKALRRPPPAYPQFAQLNGISGWVKLMFTVTAEGRTRDVRVVAAEPPGVFDAAAIDAAGRFVYSPRIENGAAVDRPNVETEITFTWIDRGGSLTTGRRPAPR